MNKLAVDFLRFFIVGSISTVINYAVYFGFSLLINDVVSNAIGYCSGLFFSLWGTHLWVYRSTNKITATRSLVFTGCYFTGGLLNSIVYILVLRLMSSADLAWLVGVSFSTVFNFLSVRLILFRRQ